jgi:hypothetical protein
MKHVRSLAYSLTLKKETTYNNNNNNNIPPKRRLTFNGLHGVIFHKRELLITTVVRTSNPTRYTYMATSSPISHEDSIKLYPMEEPKPGLVELESP